jgi:hypothetical protein
MSHTRIEAVMYGLASSITCHECQTVLRKHVQNISHIWSHTSVSYIAHSLFILAHSSFGFLLSALSNKTLLLFSAIVKNRKPQVPSSKWVPQDLHYSTCSLLQKV